MKTLIRTLAFSAALLFSSPLLAADAAKSAAAPVPDYALVKEKSSLKFIATQNGAPVEGQFKDFSAAIHFDPKQLDKSSVKIEVQTASVSATYDEVVKNLKLPDWLSVEAFPKAVFTTTKISQMPSTDNFYAEGELTLRDQKKPATLNFQMEYPDDKRAIATGYVTIKRTDFGVGQGEWKSADVVKDVVRIEFRIVADKK